MSKTPINSSVLLGYASAFAVTAQRFPFVEAKREFETMFKKQEVRALFANNMELLMGVRRQNFTELAKLIGTDHAHLSRIRAAKANTSLEMALAISQALKISLGTMLTKDLQTACETAINETDRL